MNKLPLDKKVQILYLLVEGNSLRSTSGICDVSINTVTKLLFDTGKECEKFHNDMVVNVKTKRVQVDENWSFVYSKEMNVPQGMEGKAGVLWTWTAIDVDSKLIVSWNVSNRDVESANEFMYDVAARLVNNVQLTKDGNRAYLDTVDDDSGGNIDFSQLVEIYWSSNGENKNEGKYSPVEYTGTKKVTSSGQPNDKFISTSYIERQNLTMRRFTWLTNAFSKKIENLCYAIALHFVYYNFVNIHKSISVTPAMQAGLTKKPMTLEDIAKLSDNKIQGSKIRGEYKR